MKIENTKAQMRKGLLELCILSLLAQKDAYVSDLIKDLKQSQMIVVEGTLYPLLTRLKNSGLLYYRWEESKTGPPRKYYGLTPEGKKVQQELLQSWDDLHQAIDHILHVKPSNDSK